VEREAWLGQGTGKTRGFLRKISPASGQPFVSTTFCDYIRRQPAWSDGDVWNQVSESAPVMRTIKFLERPPETDASQIGLTGHSMGGRQTAIDPRVKAASPSVGGSGHVYSDIAGVPGSARRMQQNLDLYNQTLDARNYWPLIRCPVMFPGATNDSNSPMEMCWRTTISSPV